MHFIYSKFYKLQELCMKNIYNTWVITKRWLDLLKDTHLNYTSASYYFCTMSESLSKKG